MIDYYSLFKDKTNILKGKKEIARIIPQGKIKVVLLAQDSDKNFKKDIYTLCQNNGVDYLEISNKCELGRLCQIDVPCAVVGILEK